MFMQLLHNIEIFAMISPLTQPIESRVPKPLDTSPQFFQSHQQAH
ncbi:hypothetical protein HPSNAG_1468 [Glaesserella parasuis str. Nagasaki]|nr:hypothetical protein HPSNAG_1468 [Glaesserella parasuis str. Nagasaki]